MLDDRLPTLLTRREVERIVSLSRASIYRLIKLGKFPAPIRVGIRATRWRFDDIERFMASRPAALGEGVDRAA